MDYKEICLRAIALIRQTGEFIKAERENLVQSGVESKSKHNFVTYIDKASEERLVAGLGAIIPGCGFVAEEGSGIDNGEKYRWIIDPIDGTTNFMHGAPPFSISVALQEDAVTVIGIVLEIVSGECFYSYLGGAVYVNDKEVKTSTTKVVDNALIATGFPYTDFGKIDKFMETMVYFMHNSHGLRRLGSAAMDLAYVACGRYDAFYEYSLSPWDVAAGAFLVKQAGGKVCDFSGGENWLFGKEIIATNGFVFDEFQHYIGKTLGDN